jgi:hypothetical protein
MKRFTDSAGGVLPCWSIFLAIGLTLNPRDVPSPLKDKPAPAFKLPQLAAADRSFFAGRPEGQGLAAQRLGIVVRFLPPGASAAGVLFEGGQGAHRRPQL